MPDCSNGYSAALTLGKKAGRDEKRFGELSSPLIQVCGNRRGDQVLKWHQFLLCDLAFVKRWQMLRLTRYEPHCPSPKCTGRNRSKLYHIRAKPNWLPPKVWTKKGDDQILYRCTYCGLVWFQERSKRPGFDAKPIGYWEFGWELRSSGKRNSL